MDFITGLPKSEGKSVIMVIVNRLTKYAHFCALSHPFKASTVATAFMEIVQKLHGSPKIIIGNKIPVQTIFPELDEEGKIILEPEAITDTRIRQLRNRSILEYLIKWRKLLAEDSTWEDEYLYRSIHNYSSVADNTCLKGRGMLSPK